MTNTTVEEDQKFKEDVLNLVKTHLSKEESMEDVPGVVVSLVASCVLLLVATELDKESSLRLINDIASQSYDHEKEILDAFKSLLGDE